MFGRRRIRQEGGGLGNVGLLLLFFQFMNFLQVLRVRNEYIPVTFGILTLNVVAFIRPSINGVHWPSVSNGCNSLESVYYHGQWPRIVYSSFLHADSFHLYYNMASFMWKARTLERHYGSAYFLYLTAVFSILTSLLYLAINFSLAETFDMWSYVRTCAVGFSAVIFALKVLTTHLSPLGYSYVIGIPIPGRLAVWVELVIISVIVPRASFVGHLAGILVGVAYVSGPLKTVMDIPIKLLEAQGSWNASSWNRQSYNYSARPTGFRATTREEQHSRESLLAVQRGEFTSSWRSNLSSFAERQERREREQRREEEELQQAIAASLQESSAREERDDEEELTEERPPPYNPEFSTEYIGSGFQQVDGRSNLRYDHDEWVEEEDEEKGEEEMEASRLRELRLRHFTKNHKH